MTILGVDPIINPLAIVSGEVVPLSTTAVAAPYAAAGPVVAGTSLSIVVIDTVNLKTFKVEEFNRSFFPGTRIRATATDFEDVWLEGIVTAWDGESLILNGDLSSGVGSYSSWNINVAGEPGQQGDVGPQGATGPSGGPAGPVGPAGTPGTVWRAGVGAPADALGVNGDYYLNDTTGDVYQRTASVYAIVANIEGPEGSIGATGPTGPQGIIAEAPIDGSFYSRKDGGWAPPPGGGDVQHTITMTAGAGLTGGGDLSANRTFDIGQGLGISVGTNEINLVIPVAVIHGGTGAITASAALTNLGGAPIASPVLSGAPSAPTATPGTDSLTIANTAFVKAAINDALGSAFSTGDIKMTLKTVADSGWVMFNDGTIGDVGSGSTFASTTANALFTLLFNNTIDANCPILLTGGGATTRVAQTNAATAWTNKCRLSLPKMLGRALAAAGSGAGLSARQLGQPFGSEAKTIGIEALPFNTAVYSGVITSAGYVTQTLASNIGLVNNPNYSNSGVPLNIMPPVTFLNVMVKL